MSNLNLQFLSFFLFSFFICFVYSSSSFSSYNIHSCSLIQKHALLLFKETIFSYNHSYDDYYYICHDSFGSDYYPIMMNWNTSIDCCNWDGVTCDPFTGDVISLDLSCGMLQGIIHPNSTLFNLPHLQRLNLAFNNLTGSQLPREIGRFSNSLTHLNISNCGFIGQVPTDITSLSKLVSLDLSWNIFDSRLEPHVFLNLLHNSTSLEELSLENVDISLILPTYLNISSSMKSLHLSSTSLLGELPINIFNLSYLEEVDLALNDLIGRFPKVYTNTSIPLKWLDLSRTILSGEIPDSIGHLKSLNYFDLSGTYLSGEIPDSIGHLKSLKYLDLSFTDNLSGQIPDSIGHLKSLNYLILSSTKLSGRIPNSIGHIKSLKYLDLNSNFIQGSFPPSIWNMSGIWYLDMSNNSFDGVIPQCLDNISSSLQMVDLRNNNFHGTIPNAWDDCGELEGLILNGNSLEGEVPRGLSKCEYLKVLDLGNNHLNGTFPHWLRHLPHLQVLVLKSNKLHGPIERSSIIKHPFRSLRVLDLSHNNFVGHLPQEYFLNFNSMKDVVRKGRKPQYLDIGGKFYSTTLAVKGLQLLFPKILVDYTIITLSNNNFIGEIPNVIGSLNSLKALDLSHNNLDGRIPYAIGNLLDIESLDLSWNQLTGEIPQSLADITKLEVLNLSQNHLVGRIPSGTQFSTFNTSFEGNPELCGFPLPNDCRFPLCTDCEYPNTPQLEVDGDEEDSGFTWKVVMLGYGCGIILGLLLGYLMLSTGKPKWFNAIADEIEHVVLRRQNKRRYLIYIGK